jgi:hypothetical protein
MIAIIPPESSPLNNFRGALLKKPDFVNSLEQTTCFLSVPNEIGQSVEVTNNLLWTFIEGSRNFLRICDISM